MKLRKVAAPRTTGLLGGAVAVLAAVVAVSIPAAPPAAAAVAAPPAWPLVSSGQQGVQVKTVQYLLRQAGSTITADGIFGSQTRTAVQRFQTARGLSADGVVGAGTWTALVVPLDTGDTGEAVRALQTQLNRYGAGVSVDGVFGALTGNAVSTFKSSRGLGDSTTVDAIVWQSLVGGTPPSGTYALPVARDVLPRGEYDDPHHDYPAIDLPTVSGTPAYATGSGTVVAIDNSACGIGVQVRSADGVLFMYCHFRSRVVANGATVAAGDLVGYTGNTGNSTGPHLHFELRVSGVNRCPQTFLVALYDGDVPPAPSSLPRTGCYYTSAMAVAYR